ncbi:hypothetical protein DL98DRAFT_658926 [Cadophora sp. DSE1049]|nr:hypothetical protein DL98DRAFT_658926 [Cadophora sp. DSE1049]
MTLDTSSSHLYKHNTTPTALDEIFKSQNGIAKAQHTTIQKNIPKPEQPNIEMEPGDDTKMEDATMSTAEAEKSPESPAISETEEDSSYIKTNLTSSPGAPNSFVSSRMNHYPHSFPEMGDAERVIAWKGVVKGEKIVALRYEATREISASGEGAPKKYVELGGTPLVLVRVCRGGMAGGSKVLDLERLEDGTPFGRLSFEIPVDTEDQPGSVGDVVFMRYFAGQDVLEDGMRAWRALDDMVEANPTTTSLDLVMAVLPHDIPDHFLTSPIDPAALSNHTPGVGMIEISLNRTELLFKGADVDDGYLPVNPNLPVTQHLSALLTDNVKHAFQDLKSLKPEWQNPLIDAKEFVAAIGLQFSKDLYRLLTKSKDGEASTQESGVAAKKRTFDERGSPDSED